MNRTQPRVLACASIVGALILIGDGLAAQEVRPAGSKIEIVYEVDLGELAERLPRELMLYTTKPDPVAASQQKALEAALGGRFHFEASEASGGVFAVDRSRLWMRPPKPNDDAVELSKDEVRRVAESFLDTIDGMPPKTVTTAISTDTMVFIDRDGGEKRVPMGRNTTYRRLLDGIEVAGPGGKIKTFHDLKGHVVGYLRVWRELEPAEVMPLIPMDEAIRRFEERPLGRSLLGGVSKVDVTRVQLGYLERGLTETLAGAMRKCSG